MSIRGGQKTGFILPTVVILSLGMLIFLGTSFSTILTVRKASYERYYNDLAKSATQSGIVKVKACLSANGNKIAWGNSANQSLAPGGQCEAVPDTDNCSAEDNNHCLSEDNGQKIRTTFMVKAYDSQDKDNFTASGACPKFLIVTGQVQVLNESRAKTKTVEYYLRANLDESCQLQQVF